MNTNTSTGNVIKINLSPKDNPLLLLMKEAEEAGHTIVHCNYVSKTTFINGGWVNIWPTTYLFHKPTGTHLQLLHAIEIPLAPNRHYFKKAGQLKIFTLIFPSIPKSWQNFTLKEMAGSTPGFMVHNLARNSSGVYRVAL